MSTVKPILDWGKIFTTDAVFLLALPIAQLFPREPPPTVLVLSGLGVSLAGGIKVILAWTGVIHAETKEKVKTQLIVKSAYLKNDLFFWAIKQNAWRVIK